MEEDSHQQPASPPTSTKATWQIIMVVLLIAVAMILIFWLVFGSLTGPINH